MNLIGLDMGISLILVFSVDAENRGAKTNNVIYADLITSSVSSHRFQADFRQIFIFSLIGEEAFQRQSDFGQILGE